MTAFTDYAESQVIKWLLTAAVVTRPTTWFVALHTGDPSETGAANELVGNGYARQSVALTEDTNGLVDNDADIVFGPNTTTNWGTVTHVSVWTAVTAGSCLMKGALSSSAAITVNDSLRIAAGALDLSVD